MSLFKKSAPVANHSSANVLAPPNAVAGMAHNQAANGRAMANALANAANMQAGAAPMGSWQNAHVMTVAENIEAHRLACLAKATVLEYIAAQLNMKLFGSNTLAQAIFEGAMSAALEEIRKP